MKRYRTNALRKYTEWYRENDDTHIIHYEQSAVTILISGSKIVFFRDVSETFRRTG